MESENDFEKLDSAELYVMNISLSLMLKAVHSAKESGVNLPMEILTDCVLAMAVHMKVRDAIEKKELRKEAVKQAESYGFSRN